LDEYATYRRDAGSIALDDAGMVFLEPKRNAVRDTVIPDMVVMFVRSLVTDSTIMKLHAHRPMRNTRRERHPDSHTTMMIYFFHETNCKMSMRVSLRDLNICIFVH
jgi:hypothetical protein